MMTVMSAEAITSNLNPTLGVMLPHFYSNAVAFPAPNGPNLSKRVSPWMHIYGLHLNQWLCLFQSFSATLDLNSKNSAKQLYNFVIELRGICPNAWYKNDKSVQAFEIQKFGHTSSFK